MLFVHSLTPATGFALGAIDRLLSMRVMRNVPAADPVPGPDKARVGGVASGCAALVAAGLMLVLVLRWRRVSQQKKESSGLKSLASSSGCTVGEAAKQLAAPRLPSGSLMLLVRKRNIQGYGMTFLYSSICTPSKRSFAIDRG